MAINWKRAAALFLIAFLCGVALPRTAHADSIRTITVSFTVGGADASRSALGAWVDPLYGDDTASGWFAFSSALVPEGGGALVRTRGLPVDAIRFSWAGQAWTPDNAAVTDLQFAPDGRLIGWALGGAPFGFVGIAINGIPDMSVVDPTFTPLVPQCCFNYTTPLSAQFGIFSGRLLALRVTGSPGGVPSPVPEPGSLLLVATGVSALAARVRRRR